VTRKHQSKNLIAILMLASCMSLAYAAGQIDDEHVNSSGTAAGGWTYGGSSTSSSYDPSSSSGSSSSSSSSSGSSSGVTVSQTISLEFSTMTPGSTQSLSAIAEGTGTISYTSSSTDICTVDGTTLTAVAQGTCTVTVNIAADSAYSAASTTASAIVNAAAAVQSAQTISLALSDTETDTTIDLAATAEGGGDITYASSTTNICTVDGTELSAFSIGTCTVTARIAADTNYLSASTATSITVSAGTSTTGDACNTSCSGTGMRTVGSKYGYCFNSCLYTSCGKTGYNRCDGKYLAPEALIAAKCNNTAWVGLPNANTQLFMMDGKYNSRKNWENRKTIWNHWRYSGNSKISYSNKAKDWSPSGNQRGACMWQ
jgi:hypothetical protein